MICPDDIAGDPSKSAYVGSLFSLLDDETSSWDHLLPWIPGLTHARRVYYGTRLYRVLEEAVKARQKTDFDESDTIHFMMSKGDTVKEMISVSNHHALHPLCCSKTVNLVHPWSRVRRSGQYVSSTGLDTCIPRNIS